MSGLMTAAAVVGTVGATAGYLMTQGNKRPKTYGPETKIPSLTNVAGGDQLITTLRERAAGKGLGFSQNMNDFTKQFANQRMAQLRETEMPAISARASGMGLGRSTVALNRGALSTQAAARDVDQRHAQLTMMNEQQKRNELTQSIGSLQSFVTAEGAQLSGAARLNTQQRDAQLNQELALDKREFDARQGLVKGVTSSIAGALSGGKMGGGQPPTPPTTPPSTMNLGGGNVPTQDVRHALYGGGTQFGGFTSGGGFTGYEGGYNPPTLGQLSRPGVNIIGRK